MTYGILSRRCWLQSVAAFAAYVLLTGTLSGCGNSSADDEGEVTQLTLGCNGDLLAFDKNTLSAPAGATIELTFNNRSNHHQHNWVLVNGGDEEAMAIYEAAVAAGPKNDWLPPDHDQIIVHTPLIDSGGSATIRFQAPAQAGDYRYLCSFPGHFLAGMKGTLTLT
jgi:azurin